MGRRLAQFLMIRPAETIKTVATGLKMKTYFAALLLIFGVAGLSSVAMAQTVMQACGADIQRYCPNAGPGHLKQCMKKHMQQLSPTCIGTLVKMKQGMAQ